MKKFLALTMLSALLLTACMPEGEDLQGKFGPDLDGPTAPTQWSMELSSSSPSGNRTVAASDKVLIFEIQMPANNTLEIGAQFLVTFGADGDIDPLADGTIVSLTSGGTTIGTGVFVPVDPSVPSEGTALITTTSVVALKPGEAKAFIISADTRAILAEDVELDPLTVIVEYNGKTVIGNGLTY